MLNVNVKALNLNNVTQGALDKDGYINLANPSKFGRSAFNGTSLALGNIKLIPKGNNMFRIADDIYDFDLQPAQGLSFRNIATAFAGMIHGGVFNNPLKYTDPSGYLSAMYENWDDFYSTKEDERWQGYATIYAFLRTT